ncbi:MAG: HD domain-containing protein [Oscillospiraceae bacterium]|nr:HD domain-containing protein [Oscillospiraceae bacterium]
MDITIPEKVKFIINRLESRGYEAYIVGGCVRDSLLGIKPNDYDIATNALPEQTKNCFNDKTVVETGIQHGTVTVVHEGENFEITTYRIDGEYKDKRRPDSVSFTDDLTADLSRRDFTINAMAYSDRTGIIDRFGGQKDLFNHLIRCVGEPKERFNEDALRILRAIRFAAQLGFNMESLTALAVHDMKRNLRDVSAERIRDELIKLICGISPAEIMIEFSDVFEIIIPEIRRSVGFDQHSRYHIYDVWEHTAYSVENSKSERDVRLALLLHDIEKPSCFRFDEEGCGHFPNHEKKGAETAENIMKRLRFDNETIRNVSEIIKYHYVTPVDDHVVVKRLLSKLGEKNLGKLIEVMKGDSRAKQSFCLERVAVLDSMKIRVYEIINNNECYSLKQLAVNGTDAENAGLSGKEIGSALEYLLSGVIDNRFENTREALLAALSDHAVRIRHQAHL